ncbi:MAG TPA: endo-1,4-beta-xylanase [Verrucomicrobiales bacterium]|nr:endo-1,4-beta-xylanase [Verrucomicrobiales bacterium]
MNASRLCLLLTLLLSLSLPAAEADAPQIYLWPAGAPGARGTEDHDRPSVTPFPASPAAIAAGPVGAVVVCPGGGYGGLAGHEGKDYALWLNQQGVAAFVLKYRLGSHGYRHPRMLEDAARAVRWVRSHAAEYHVDPKRVGIMGSSAGGHLASSLVTHFSAGEPSAPDPVEKESSRPDFGILCYAVISMGEVTHQGSKNNLLGADPSPELVQLMSNELQVTPQTPPCFVWHTWEDKAVKVENSMLFAAALQKNGVPFDLHIYQNGPHGIGLRDKAPFEHAHAWTRDLAFWLKERGITR